MRVDFFEAIKLSPKEPANYILRGRAKMNLKDYNGALKDFDIAISLNPNNEEAWYYRGLAKMEQRDNSARADFSKALTLGSTDAADAIKKYSK
ncbi:lipoprotein NlpI [mine drainage metagenome]|uniref:Lipoprotein NlpI n=1 Tax=mine drainage metagenome TaxID=410659 RepID=A0A1J5NZD9_9ZZZZ